MTYNEYAQVLEAKNPATGQLYQPEDLNVISMESVGTAMLQDHVFVRGDWLKDNEDTAVKFLRASFRGWIFCRDHFQECVDIVLKNGPTLGNGHMTWQLNEINALIWPSPNGIGIMDPASWDRTVSVSTEGKVITKAPTDGAYRDDLAKKALEGITDDTKGTSFTKQEVQVTEGGA
jgi:NitT/TauT family transport system substrate-binding protein